MEEHIEQDNYKHLENRTIEPEKEPVKQESVTSNNTNKETRQAEPGTAPDNQEKKKNYKRYYRQKNNYRNKQHYQKNPQTPNLNITNSIISVIIPVYNEEESVV